MQDTLFIDDCNQNIDRSFFNFPIFYCRFAIFRRCLDAEMEDSTRQGVSLQTKKEEKEDVTDENEEKFWSAGLFGSGTAQQLLDTIYFYNGKMFGLRGGEHRIFQRIIQGWSKVPTRLYYSYNELRLRLLKAKQKYKLLRNTNDSYETTKIHETERN